MLQTHIYFFNSPFRWFFIVCFVSPQVAKILAPVVLCLKGLDRVLDEDSIPNKRLPVLIHTAYGSRKQARRVILSDFFKFAFDGSGGDNYFEAGSCIDGRLTSAWNWCNQLPEKHFFPLFLATGFIGFDGSEWDN